MELRKGLFWDVKLEEVDLEKHARFVLTRIFERGNLQEIRDCINHYGTERAKEELTQARWLSPVTLAFCCCIFDLKKEAFRCYTLRQSLPQLGDW